MEAHGDHFAAEGIPLTEFEDSDLVNPEPYQLATVIVRDSVHGGGTGADAAGGARLHRDALRQLPL